MTASSSPCATRTGKLSSANSATPGGFEVWHDPFTCFRIPKIFNLRMDPYERADIVSDQYYDWLSKNAYLMRRHDSKAADFLETFVDYPPSQTPGELHRRPGRGKDEADHRRAVKETNYENKTNKPLRHSAA